MRVLLVHPSAPTLLAASRDGAAHEAPGAITPDGFGPQPVMLESIDHPRPARDLWTGATSTSSACSIRPRRSSSPGAVRGTARSVRHTESRKLTTLDYRLFDIQHAVLPTTFPLDEFHCELVRTQSVINRKQLGATALLQTAGIVARWLAHGQTNFAKMLRKFSGVYDPVRLRAEHNRPTRYELPCPTSTRSPHASGGSCTSIPVRLVTTMPEHRPVKPGGSGGCWAD